MGQLIVVRCQPFLYGAVVYYCDHLGKYRVDLIAYGLELIDPCVSAGICNEVELFHHGRGSGCRFIDILCFDIVVILKHTRANGSADGLYLYLYILDSEEAYDLCIDHVIYFTLHALQSDDRYKRACDGHDYDHSE